MLNVPLTARAKISFSEKKKRAGCTDILHHLQAADIITLNITLQALAYATPLSLAMAYFQKLIV